LSKVIKRIIVTIFVLTVLIGSGCRTDNQKSNEPEQNPGRQITDDVGNRVNLPNDVTRAVSLAPNLTEIIFAVGAGEKLVGVTTFCNYPEEAKNIRKVGDTLKPNIEDIIALRPQVVFVSTASQLETFAGTLEKQNINVFITNPNTLEDIYQSIKTIGEIFRQDENALKLTKELKERVKAVEEKTGEAEKVKSFIQIDKSLFTIGKESFITDLIEKAGGISVTKDVATAYPKISKEKALALDPEAIILSDSPDNNAPNDVFANSPAVKNKRVYKINADILSRPGPRIVDALEQIGRSLHPERFK
jgi:iron complex transport system substrate-binding protein